MKSLEMFGVAPEPALALTLNMHVWMLVATSLLGVLGVAMQGNNLSKTYAESIAKGRTAYTSLPVGRDAEGGG